MKLVRALALLATAGVLILAPTAADAASSVHADGTGDVRFFALEGEPSTPQPMPERTESDITSIRVNHLARTVKLTLTFRELDRHDLGKLFSFRSLSDKGVREIDINATGGKFYGVRSITNARGQNVPCAGASHRVDYVNDVVRVVVPRICFGSPRWVRVAGFAASYTTDGYAIIDDARSTNYFGSSFVYGPRVYKG